MGKLSPKGILLGGVADVVASNILGIPLVVYTMRSLDLAHIPQDQLQEAAMDAIHSSPSLLTAQILIGASASVFGGYVAARISNHDEVINGGFSSWLCVVIGVCEIALGKGTGNALLQAGQFIASPVAGLFGGYLRLKQKQARSN